MTLTQREIESAWQEAEVMFRSWLDEQEEASVEDRQLGQMLGKSIAAAMVASMGPEQLEYLRQMDPEKYDRVMKKIGGE